MLLLLLVAELIALANSLTCMTCRKQRYLSLVHNEINRFRMLLNSPTPYCYYREPIECHPEQGLCLTYTLNLGQKWWVGMGCGTHDEYDVLGCKELRSQVKNRHQDQRGQDYVRTHKVAHTLCTCETDKCNCATRTLRETRVLVLLCIAVIMYYYL